MTEKEMIEEMAEIQCDSCKKYTGESEDCNSAECLFIRKKYANELIKQGYRKIPEGSVVLTIEEVDEFRKDSAEVKFLKNKIIEQARKEMVKELLSMIDKVPTNEVNELNHLRLLKINIAKQSGVEVEE